MRPRVLLFIDWFYPGYRAGGPVTSNLNMVEQLRKKIDFFVVTRNSDYGDTTPYSEVPPDRWVTLREGVSVYYFSQNCLSVSTLWKVVKQAQCSIWYINGIYSRYFSILPLLFAKVLAVKRVIVASRGMLSKHAFSVKGEKKRFFLHIGRLLGLYRGVRFHATNAEEAASVSLAIGPRAEVYIAPNLPSPPSEAFQAKQKNVAALRLIALSRVSPEKNCLLAIEILARCSACKIQLDWYGQQPDLSYVQSCKAKARQLPANISVVFHGGVAPSSIAALLREADFFFLPSRGENFGHAIIEALLSGTPVIISDTTPWRQLEEKNIGWDIPLLQPDRFAEVIESAAAMNQDTYQMMSLDAFSFASEQLRNPETLAATLKLFICS